MASIMEGPLSKWTNVMKGWQYRWFVLDYNAGLLSYYTVRTSSCSELAAEQSRTCVIKPKSPKGAWCLSGVGSLEAGQKRAGIEDRL